MSAADTPCIGSTLAKLRLPEATIVPHVCLPYMTKEGAGGPPQPGFFGGYIGNAFDSFVCAPRPQRG